MIVTAGHHIPIAATSDGFVEMSLDAPAAAITAVMTPAQARALSARLLEEAERAEATPRPPVADDPSDADRGDGSDGDPYAERAEDDTLL